MLQTLDLFFLLQIRVWKNSVYRYIFRFCVIYLDPEARSLFLDPTLSLCIYHPVLKLHIEVCLPWAWAMSVKDIMTHPVGFDKNKSENSDPAPARHLSSTCIAIHHTLLCP